MPIRDGVTADDVVRVVCTVARSFQGMAGDGTAWASATSAFGVLVLQELGYRGGEIEDMLQISELDQAVAEVRADIARGAVIDADPSDI